MVSRLICVCLVLVLIGCNMATFGNSTNYPFEYPDKIEIEHPPNAPSIVHQFYTSPGPGARSESAHEGFDVWAKLREPILAAAPGRVIASYREPLYGNRVHIDHGPGPDGRAVITRYFHLDERLVKKGDQVRRGQKIGLMGNTGALGLAIHLHFEVRRPFRGSTRPEDPNLWWMDGVGKVTCFEPRKRYPSRPVRMTHPVACK